MKPLELAGKRFGRLTVIERAPRDVSSRSGNLKWFCVCDCGEKRLVIGSGLVNGKTQSCGCLSAEIATKLCDDLTGKRFGRLTVKERAGSDKHGRAKWRAVCECGGETCAMGFSLRLGNTLSCGCLAKERFIEAVRGEDLTGKMFGLLRVEGMDSVSRGRCYWSCVCECGCKAIASTAALNSGRKNSCGCARKTTNKPGVAPITPPHVRAVLAAQSAARRARVRKAGGTFTAAQVDELFKKQRGRCAGPNCGIKLSKAQIRRDHRTALANGGSNYIWNIEILCNDCNSRKSSKDEIAWANENGRLL